MMDMIKNAGGHIWVHSHGRMRGMLSRFADMGVDVLNPIEPPPMGDIELAEAFAVVGDRMGLEGNIETHDLMTCSAAELREKVRAAVRAGAGRRFILCPSTGYMEDPQPTERFISNLLLYIDEGVRAAEEGVSAR
jgi:uroporphyrinogen-III decarboxylase